MEGFIKVMNGLGRSLEEGVIWMCLRAVLLCEQFGALLFQKIPLKLDLLCQPQLYSVLSVFPSSSDASTHFHIETPSIRFQI